MTFSYFEKNIWKWIWYIPFPPPRAHLHSKRCARVIFNPYHVCHSYLIFPSSLWNCSLKYNFSSMNFKLKHMIDNLFRSCMQTYKCSIVTYWLMKELIWKEVKCTMINYTQHIPPTCMRAHTHKEKKGRKQNDCTRPWHPCSAFDEKINVGADHQGIVDEKTKPQCSLLWSNDPEKSTQSQFLIYIVPKMKINRRNLGHNINSKVCVCLYFSQMSSLHRILPQTF